MKILSVVLFAVLTSCITAASAFGQTPDATSEQSAVRPIQEHHIGETFGEWMVVSAVPTLAHDKIAEAAAFAVNGLPNVCKSPVDQQTADDCRQFLPVQKTGSGKIQTTVEGQLTTSTFYDWKLTDIAVASAQACPVVIRHIESSNGAKAGLLAALAGAGASNTYLMIKYENVSGKVVTGIRFTVTYLNSVREPINTHDVTTPSKTMKPGKSFQVIEADGSITGGERLAVLGMVAKVLFADGSSWAPSQGQSCVVLSPGK